jgi:hypothetical protein
MSETMRPWIIREGGVVEAGTRVVCENGHFQAILSEIHDELGWPTLLDAKGEDITAQFAGRPFPVLCNECGAVAIDQAPSSPTNSENEK